MSNTQYHIWGLTGAALAAVAIFHKDARLKALKAETEAASAAEAATQEAAEAEAKQHATAKATMRAAQVKLSPAWGLLDKFCDEPSAAQPLCAPAHKFELICCAKGHFAYTTVLVGRGMPRAPARACLAQGSDAPLSASQPRAAEDLPDCAGCDRAHTAYQAQQVHARPPARLSLASTRFHVAG